MYEIAHAKKFKTSYKKLIKSGRSDFDDDELKYVVHLLSESRELPEKYRDHSLRGNFQGLKECHITSNILLIYEVDTDNKIITLSEMGTHAQLFGL
jgi:mRNA interferase YafQ